jgi:excisionase family DNA binding protein
MLGVSRYTIYRMVQQRTLTVMRVGSQIRILLTALPKPTPKKPTGEERLDAWIKKHCIQEDPCGISCVDTVTALAQENWHPSRRKLAILMRALDHKVRVMLVDGASHRCYEGLRWKEPGPDRREARAKYW